MSPLCENGSCYPEQERGLQGGQENGTGVEKNEALAQEWYDKAKEAGYEP